MEIKVTGLQKISSMCFLCGEDNAFGLHGTFYNLEDGGLYAIFRPQEEHQSYPGRVHGGVLSAIVDEMIGRAIQNKKPEIWGVTAELQTRFRKPVSLDKEIRVIAYITKENSRMFEGTATIFAQDDSVAVEGFAKYVKQPVLDLSQNQEAGAIMRPDTQEYPETITL